MPQLQYLLASANVGFCQYYCCCSSFLLSWLCCCVNKRVMMQPCFSHVERVVRAPWKNNLTLWPVLFVSSSPGASSIQWCTVVAILSIRAHTRHSCGEMSVVRVVSMSLDKPETCALTDARASPLTHEEIIKSPQPLNMWLVSCQKLTGSRALFLMIDVYV